MNSKNRMKKSEFFSSNKYKNLQTIVFSYLVEPEKIRCLKMNKIVRGYLKSQIDFSIYEKLNNEMKRGYFHDCLRNNAEELVKIVGNSQHTNISHYCFYLGHLLNELFLERKFVEKEQNYISYKSDVDFSFLSVGTNGGKIIFQAILKNSTCEKLVLTKSKITGDAFEGGQLS
jgi:hypothetical protein